MDKIRLVYERTGRAVWISHLDMMRMLQRAMNRAGVPIRYSEGFNPHALVSILMPLSVGTESLCQMVDIRVKEDVDLSALPQRLTAVMPEGIRFRKAYENGAKAAQLKWLRVEGVWEYDANNAAEAEAVCRELFSGPVSVMRRTKRGEGLLELNEHIRELSFCAEAEGRMRVCALVSAADPVVNPDLIAAAVRQHRPDFAPSQARFCRIALYDNDMAEFA